jgi:hypothetical protein
MKALIYNKGLHVLGERNVERNACVHPQDGVLLMENFDEAHNDTIERKALLTDAWKESEQIAQISEERIF